LCAAVVGIALAGGAISAQSPDWSVYRDARGRFSFEYPVAFGAPGRGTNDGFEDRVAAVRFPNLRELGGEVALTRGRIVLDIQALGGLYDPIALEVFPEAMRRQVVALIPPVTAENICQQLAAPDHLGAAPDLTPAVRDIAGRLDRVRHVDPRVVRCDVKDRVVVFHKEATFETPAAVVRQHLFGAVRFLDPPFSAVQFVRGMNMPPSTEDLDTAARIVRSFTP